ncbi:MAG: hypothetical protein EA392_00360 [Cryomorphaceae bacterium]|nr:MAG: hypothetical protein EA392_00360 [Cryomorphaceae bacterium]
MTLRTRITTAPGFTNLNREFTWEELDENFIELLNLIQTEGADAIVDFDPAVEYVPGVAPLFVSFGGNIYKNVAAEEHTGVTPGTDPSIWALTSTGDLVHEQNTDVRLGRFHADLSGAVTETFNLYTSAFINKNYFALLNTVDCTYTFRTADPAIRQTKRGQFMVFVPDSAGYKVTLPDNAFQSVGGVDLVLEAGDFAVFEGDVEGKSLLIASNKITFQTEDIAFTEQSGHPVVTDQVLRITVDGQDYDINVKKL